MTVPPDIGILLIFAAVFVVAVYLIDWKLERDKKKLEQETIHL